LSLYGISVSVVCLVFILISDIEKMLNKNKRQATQIQNRLAC